MKEFALYELVESLAGKMIKRAEKSSEKMSAQM